MQTLFYIVLANFLISLGGLVGIFTLKIKDKKLDQILHLFVSLSAGALMGGAFLHLLPEMVHEMQNSEHGEKNMFTYVLLSFIAFYIIEKYLHWHHCHKLGKDHKHTFGYMNLIGDTVHNFIDGLIIATSFMIDTNLGIVTAFAIAMHEIPQEIGDFGVLLYSGFSKTQALVLNYLVALTTVLGGIVGYFLSVYVQNFVQILLPIAAGGFIYIAASDLIPELKKEPSTKKSAQSFIIFIIGILIMYVARSAHE